ncbi:hypothetical protein B0H10DRAFT_1779807 [Mycena sp. CBHHK59/15]|nr:hypothetical protein B0H10DRAFT_1779807 [Mycena sp. CBHHK59/15]
MPPVPIHDHNHHPRDSPRNSVASSLQGTDEEDNDDDYDWSGEDDLVDEEAKFEERMGNKVKKSGWGFKRIVTILFSSLIGSTFLAGVLATPAILLLFFWYKPDKTAYRHKVVLNVEAWLFWAAANLVISWYLAMLIDVVPTLVRLLISASWGHVSEMIKSRIEMYNSVKNSVKPIFYAASAWLSWVIIFGHIYGLYDPSGTSATRQGYTSTVFQVIEFCFFLTLVLCAQRLLSHVIAFAFHRTAFKDRIDAVQETLLVVEKLREYHPRERPRSGAAHRSGLRTPLFGSALAPPALDKEHFSFLSKKLRDHKRALPDADADSESDGGSVRKGKKPKRKGKARGGDEAHELDLRQPSAASSRPATPPPLPQSADASPHRYPPSRGEANDATLVGAAAKVLKTAVLHDARNIKGKDDAAGMQWNVNSAHEAKRLARSIYMRFKNPTRKYLLPADFYPAFPDATAADAAFRVFDKDNNGDLSRAELKTTLMKVYKERRFLARAMRDVGAALRTLDHMLLLFALLAQFFISLSVFGVDVEKSLTSVYTIGIGASFIFKTAASGAFDSIMFLFVTHPYDTGDRCFIDDEILVVKKMGLFATVFTRWDGTETYYFNSQLATKFITNVRRSGKMFENLTMQIAWRTPLAKLDALEAAMNTWLSTEENRWFVPSTSITLQHIDFQRYLEVTMAIGHNGTWQDWGLRSARKTAFHAAVQHYCRELGIVCYNSPQPIVYGDPSVTASQPPAAGPDGGNEGGNEGGVASEPAAEDLLLRPEEEAALKPAPALGFVPHMTTGQLRARKSAKGKKAAMLAAGGGGDMGG